MSEAVKTQVTFTSEKFRPVLPEECQVNPGCYGAELAYWLCRELVCSGVVTSYPNYEDWGWFIEYITADGDEFWLCCGNINGTDREWICFLEPKCKGMFGTRKPQIEEATPLLQALAGVLESNPTIGNIEWSQNER